jgi:hypothetical protein
MLSINKVKQILRNENNMRKSHLLLLFVILFFLSPYEQYSYAAYPFPNVFWFYWDTVYVENQTHWNMIRSYDNRYWVIALFNDDEFFYYNLDILVSSNTTIDIFLFGQGAASNEIGIPEGTKIGTQQFSFGYTLEPHTGYRDWCVYLYIDNSDDDGRGVAYNGDALVSIDINITQTVVPIIIEYLYVFIPFGILMTAFFGAIFYINKKRKLFETIKPSANNKIKQPFN